jgi:gluconokinase
MLDSSAYMLVMALDVGTSSARALCYDSAGAPVRGAAGRVGYEATTAATGAVELDPDALVEAAAGAIDQCLAGAGSRAGEIEAVGASVFWHSLLALGPDRRPLTQAITWADTRSAAAARALREAVDPRAVHARTGAPIHTTFWPAKLWWLRGEHPEVFRRAHTWCGFAEYLGLVLTGELRASLSMVSATGLLEQDTCRWDPDMLAVCGVEAGRLPPVDETPRSGLAGRFAARWPVLARVPWLPGWGDGVCSNLGSDCWRPDRVALNVGTSAAIRLVTTAPATPPAGLWRYRVDRARALVGGATSEGGNVLAWCRRSLALPERAGELNEAISRLAPDAHGLTALPFFAGERSPGWRGDARAAIAGLWLGSGPLEIARALLESVACRLAIVYERLQPLAEPGHAVVASGGALHHLPSWADIIADALGVPIVLADEPEASSRGAALLALEALGAPAPPRAPTGPVVEPDPAHHDRYRIARKRQDRLYESVVPPQALLRQ